ncbi:hypothetical protein [Paenibacillus sp. FSL K6-2524]|uniref:hypothetical protein n=1 Tax=Paenibacillus sp. FSL K6-2524 TaxID=2954516 RepID=UPI0030FA7F50
MRNDKQFRLLTQESIPRRLVLIIGITSLLVVSGCNLSPDPETLQRQVSKSSWSGPSVSNGVYGPGIIDDIYSKE